MLPKSPTEPAPDAPDAREEYKSGKRLDNEGVGLLTVEEEYGELAVVVDDV